MTRDVEQQADRRRRRDFTRGSLVCQPIWVGLIALSLNSSDLSVTLAAGQPAEGVADSLARIDADYNEQRARVDRERIERLTRLAASQKGGEAELTYLEIFRFAVASDRYVDAEPGARQVIRSGTAGPECAFLAQLVNIIAKAERGDYDGSLRDLKAFIASRPPGAAAAAQVPARTLLTIGEAYYRRLVRARKFDVAREACDLVVARTENPAVRDHFTGYRKRLDLVGRPAPGIRGVDVDGGKVRLDDLKGKVVLVDFWATWCNPCVERLPIMNRALELHEKDGFAILGVNVDTGAERARITRQFIVEFGVSWPNVLSGEGGSDIANTYGVTEIPANVLIGRDGTVITIDLASADLLRAVAQAVGPSNSPRGNNGR